MGSGGGGRDQQSVVVASLGVVVATNSHGLPPVPAHTSAGSSSGPCIPADTAARAVITPAYPSSQTRSLSRLGRKERGQGEDSLELPVPSHRLSEADGAHHYLSSLSKDLACGTYENKVLVVWKKSLSAKHDQNRRDGDWEKFQEGDESEELSSKSRSYLMEMSSDPRSLPPADLQGKKFKVSAVDNWPFFGITYEVVLEEGGQWGGPQADGTVTGMIGMVARGEAHLAINEITITAARETVVDFTRPYFMESSACTSPAPKERSRAFAVLSPFTLQAGDAGPWEGSH
ncbi:hypothetical protein O3P69_018015 [Scylla paramamosain]|uniref:Ionotropic glutamate receptor L-glutamate and glycine-binding domain-containing protein n=1 Tax=Scylla paramamosain TaxID=85552 RepID=A0AAW0TKU9_SCYPA